MAAPYSSHNLIAFGAYPDDVEAVMGGTVVKPVEKASSLLVVDLCDGELARHAGGSERARQAKRAARILGVGRVTLSLQDRLIQDTISARLNRVSSSRLWDQVFIPIKKPQRDRCEGNFYAWLPKPYEISEGAALPDTEPREIQRLSE